MKYYFAPMEGVTLYPLRNVHKKMFGEDVDKYYTPFITATKDFRIKKREMKDILPHNNSAFSDYGKEISVQIMSGKARTFVWAAREMEKLGYRDLNLNLGCPASTVVNRHKGAGLLTDVEYLDSFLRDIFEELKEDDTNISLKTRLGFFDEDEARDLMQIYARYPIKELIIHARVREDFYANAPRLDAFKEAVKIYRQSGGTADICYNGDIVSPESLRDTMEALGDVKDEIAAVMIGRGALADPALFRVLNGGDCLQAEELREYLRALYDGYASFIPEDRNVIFKLLEHWVFLQIHFAECEKQLKRIRKSRTKGEYTAAVNSMFSECKLI